MTPLGGRCPNKVKEARLMFKSFKLFATVLGVVATVNSLPPKQCAAQFSLGAMERPHRKAAELLDKLRDEKLREIPKSFFDSMYYPDLPGLVVYSGKNGNVNLCLTQDGEKKNELIGARDVWVMVFSVNESFETISPETTSVTEISTGRKAGKVFSDTLTTKKVTSKHEYPKAKLVAVNHKIGIGERGLLSLITAIPAALGVTVGAPGKSDAPKGYDCKCKASVSWDGWRRYVVLRNAETASGREYD
jgi:hypothetical protein